MNTCPQARRARRARRRARPPMCTRIENLAIITGIAGVLVVWLAHALS